MIFTAYFDESGTHGPNPTVTVAGLLGHAYQWRIFKRDLDRIRAELGFRVFHAKELKHRSGEFSGWDDKKCSRLVDAMVDLVHRRLTEGAAVDLPRKQYLDDSRAPPFPPKMQPDTQYGLCFRVCLGHLLEIVSARSGKRHTLHVVVEAGHKNVGDLARIFKELKMWMGRRGVELLGSIKIAQKSESDELMVADFLAHTYWTMRANNPLLLQQLPEQDGNRTSGQAGLTYLELRPDTFQEFKDIYARERQATLDEWRARHAANGS